jgi:hypothetical protein
MDALDKDFEALKRMGVEKELRDEAAAITLPSLTARRLIRESAALNQGEVARFCNPKYSRQACQLWETSNVSPGGIEKLRYYWLLTRLLVEVLAKEKTRLDDINKRYTSLFAKLEAQKADEVGTPTTERNPTKSVA